MNKKYIFYFIIFFISIIGCNENSEQITEKNRPQINADTMAKDTIVDKVEVINYDTSVWKELTWERDSIVIDMRYATNNNFTKEKIYNCGRCFLRSELANKIRQASVKLRKQKQSYIKVFDCYRPRPAQQKLWNIVPNASYVTPPKKGSMHNKGLAVDLTIVDSNINEWDMGSEFDDLSKASHIDNLSYNDTIINNRRYLIELLREVNLKGIRTEWWHYSLKNVAADFSDWEWECK